MLSSVIVVKREEIPAIFEIEDEGRVYPLGEHRDFRRHPAFKEHIPPTGEFGISWAYLMPGQVLPVHVHPIVSMIVVVAGTGHLLGDRIEELQEGDAVLVGAGCRHGFAGSGCHGLRVLTIQFEQHGMYANVEKPLVNFVRQESTLDALLDYNKQRLRAIEQSAWFQMTQNSVLEDSATRAKFLASLHAFSCHFQTIMYARQASCDDERYRAAFLEHLQAEIGHDDLLKKDLDCSERFWDPVVEAVSAWFVSRMHILDSCEKAAIVHLVLETAGEKFHSALAMTMKRFSTSKYFQEHSDEDGHHVRLGVELLRNLHPSTYARLKHIVSQAWDMFDVLAEHMPKLILDSPKQAHPVQLRHAGPSIADLADTALSDRMTSRGFG